MIWVTLNMGRSATNHQGNVMELSGNFTLSRVVTLNLYPNQKRYDGYMYPVYPRRRCPWLSEQTVEHDLCAAGNSCSVVSMTSVLPVTRAVVKHYWYNVFFVAFETQEAFEGDKTGRSWPMLHSSTLWWCDSCKCFMTCNFGSYVSAVIVLRLLSNCDEMLESVVQGSHTSRLSIWKSQKFFPQISRPWNIPWKFCLLNYTVVVSSRL